MHVLSDPKVSVVHVPRHAGHLSVCVCPCRVSGAVQRRAHMVVWTQHASGGTLPDTESAGLVEVAGTAVLVGGYCEGEDVEEEIGDDDDDDIDEVLKTYTYNAAGKRWRRTVHRDVPHLEGLAAVSFGSYALLHGGLDADYEVRDDVYLLTLDDLGVPAVRKLDPEGTAPRRMRHAACRFGDALVVFGGKDDDGVYNDVARLVNTAGPGRAAAEEAGAWVWEAVPITGEARPPPRSNAVIACAGRDAPTVALFGGAYTEGADQRSYGDLWLLDTAAGAWREVPVACAPRNGHVGGIFPATTTFVVVGGGAGAGAGGGADGSYDDRPMLINTADGSVRYLEVAGAPHPSTRYMPAGALRCSGPPRFLLATGTKRLSGPNDLYELSLEGVAL